LQRNGGLNTMPYADIGGCRLHYTDRGEGTAIFFIHPPVLTSLNFEYQLERLSPYCRTVAFDIRGHGKSEPSAEPLTYPLIAEDIRRLMDRLEIGKAYLCGYSTGGSIVMEFMLIYPERCLGGISIGGMPEVSDRPLRGKISLGRIVSHWGAMRVIALALALAQCNGKLGYFKRLYHDSKRTNAQNAEQYYRSSLVYNCTDRLGQLRQPMLLVYGEKDKPFHPYARLLHDNLPQSKLVWIEKTDHRIPTKAADRLNEEILRFIGSGGHRPT